MDLVVDIYRATEAFPNTERFGLTQQVRRSAVSVPSNIAEGAFRNTDKEFNHFLGVANGSAAEVYTQLELARRLKYLQQEEAESILDRVNSTKRMIIKLKQSIG